MSNGEGVYDGHDVRCGFLDVLQTLVGLTAPDPAYLKLICPGDSPDVAKQWAKESDCILVALGAEELYFDCPPRGPYVGGSAPRQLEERAGGTPMNPGGAMRLATPEAPPQPGDAVWYGESATVRSEHVEHVVAVNDNEPGVLVLTVIAGGERTASGAETIKELTRTVEWHFSHYVDRGTGRPIIGVVDCDLLAERLGIA